MEVFIDAGPFIAISNKDDACHENAVQQFPKLAGFGKLSFTSDYVLDEVISYTIKKTKNPELVLKIDELIQESANIQLLKVDEEILATSKMFLKKYPEMLLSLTDWTSAVLARKRSIEKIYSYDSGFDKLKNVKEFKSLKRVNVL